MKMEISIFILLTLYASISCTQLEIKSEKTVYYQEKYFRFLANNYDEIQQGDFWTSFPEEKGIGFKAVDDFGSFVLVKDWSMYSFKLTKIVFRPYCPYTLNGKTFEGEMLLIHTIDNGYYPPGRRLYLGINYLVISVPFKQSSDLNPANDKLFHFMSLETFRNAVLESQNLKISPFKSIKLHQIIQHQPSYLFETKLSYNGNKALYMIFSQYHYIAEKDFKYLQETCSKIFGNSVNWSDFADLDFDTTKQTIFRNWDNPKELLPKATLMAYNSHWYLKLSELLLFVAVAVLL